MNTLVQRHREQNPNDTRSDFELTWYIGQAARAKGLSIADLPEDFQSEYLEQERLTRPGLGEELAQGFRRGTQNLLATGAGALALGSDMIGFDTGKEYFADAYRNRSAAAAEDAPSVQGYREVDSFGDALQYLSGLTGEVTPSLLESVVTGVVGAGIGSAATPAGTVGGGLAGFAGKGAIKSFLRNQLTRSFAKDLTEKAIGEIVDEAAKRATRRGIFDAVGENLIGRGLAQETVDQALNAARRRAAAAAVSTGLVVADSMAQNAGQTYGELLDENVSDWDRIGNSLASGAFGGALDSVLPATVLRRLGLDIAGKEAIKETMNRSLRGRAGEFFATLGKDASTEALTESAQEAVQAFFVSRATGESINLADLSDRMINAAIAGAVGGTVLGGPTGLYHVARRAEPEGTTDEPMHEETIGQVTVRTKDPLTDDQRKRIKKIEAMRSTVQEEFDEAPEEADFDLTSLFDQGPSTFSAARRESEASLPPAIANPAPLPEPSEPAPEPNAEPLPEPAAPTIPPPLPTPETPLPQQPPSPPQEAGPAAVAPSSSPNLPPSTFSPGSTPPASTIPPSQISDPKSQIPTSPTPSASAALSLPRASDGTPGYQFIPVGDLSTDPDERRKQLNAQARAPRTVDTDTAREAILDHPVVTGISIRDRLDREGVAEVVTKLSTKSKAGQGRITKNDRYALAKAFDISADSANTLIGELRKIKKQATSTVTPAVTRNAVVLQNRETGEVEVRGYFQDKGGKGKYRVHGDQGKNPDFDSFEESHELLGYLHFPELASDDLRMRFPNVAAFDAQMGGTYAARPATRQEINAEAKMTASKDEFGNTVRQVNRTVSSVDTSQMADPNAVSPLDADWVLRDDMQALFKALDQALERYEDAAPDEIAFEVDGLLAEDEFQSLSESLARQIVGAITLSDNPNENRAALFDAIVQAVTSLYTQRQSFESFGANAGSSDRGLPGITDRQLPHGSRPVLGSEGQFDQASGEYLTPHEPPLDEGAIDRELEKANNPKFTKAHYLAREFASTFKWNATATKAMIDLLERLNRADPVAFQSLQVVLDDEPPAVMARDGFTAESHRGGYHREERLFWVNASHPENDGDGAFLAVLHEMGHWFIDNAVLEDAATGWLNLTDAQRSKAWKAYSGQTVDGAELRLDLVAMHEWAVGQYTRIVRGGLEDFNKTAARMRKDGVSDSLINQLYEFYLSIREIVQTWIGSKELSSNQLDQAVRYALGLEQDPNQGDFKFDFRGRDQSSFGLPSTPESISNLPSHISNLQGLQSLGLPSKKPKADLERDLRLGFSALTGYERADLYLQRAHATWGVLREVYDAVRASISEHHHQFFTEHNLSGDKFYDRLTYGTKNPAAMQELITGKGEFEALSFDEMEGDAKNSVAHYAAIELSATIDRNLEGLDAAKEKLQTIESDLKAITLDDPTYQPKMQQRAKYQREIAARGDLDRAYNRRLEAISATYEGTPIGNIIEGTHIPIIPSVESTLDDIQALEFDWNDPDLGLKTKEAVKQMVNWMLHPGNREQHPYLYNVLAAWNERLGRTAYEAGHFEATSWFRRSYFAPLAKRLSRLGIGPTGDANRMLYQFQAIFGGNLNDSNRMGRKSNALRKRFFKAAGLKANEQGYQTFTRLIDTPAKKYMEQIGATFPGLFTHLQGTPAGRYLTPDSKSLLQQYLEAEHQGTVLATMLTGKYQRVEDSRVKLIDPNTGKRENQVRPAIGLGTMTFMVRPNTDTIGLFVESMQGRWGKENNVAGFAEMEDNKQAELLDLLFGGDDGGKLVRKFLEPLIYKEKAPAFYTESSEGDAVLAEPVTIHAVWDESGHDPVAFLSLLSNNSAEVMQANLESLNKFYSEAEAIWREYLAKKDAPGGGTPNIAVNARQRDNLPSGWLHYRQGGETDNRILLANIAFESAFGRGGEEFRDRLKQAELYYERLRIQYNDLLERSMALDPKERVKWITEQAGSKDMLAKMQHAEERASEVRSIRKGWEGVFQSELSQSQDMGRALELMSLLINGVLNGVRAAWVQFNSVYFPVLFYGRSGTSAKQVWNSGRYGLQSIFGSFFEAFGLTLNRNNELLKLNRFVRGADGDAGLTGRDVFDSVLGDWGRDGDALKDNRRRMLRSLNAFYRRGYKKVKPEETLYASFNPFTPFRTTIDGLNDGAVMAMWSSYNELATKAINYIRQHAHLPETDPKSPFHPKFKFSAKDLGYTNKLFGLVENERAFDQMTWMLAHDVGQTLESVAMGAYRNPPANGFPFTREQYQKLATLALGYMTSEGNNFTTRTVQQHSAFGRWLLPILGWPIQQPNNFVRLFRTPEGQATAATITSGLITMGSLVLPATLGFSLFMDWWDEEAMGKKSSLRPLFTGDAFDQMAAINERFTRWGPVGMPAELMNLVFNIGGEGGDTRTLSLDNRILLANSIRGLTQTVGNLYAQGPENATYATVWRPLLASGGFGGWLQNFQLASNLLGADTLEARVNQRTNVNNWLRAYGKAAGLEVKNFGSAYATPTAMTPHVTNMILAALANDGGSFRDAYRDAIEAAIKEGKADPADAVQRSFQSRHPLKSIFRTAPDSTEFAELMRLMPTDGRQAVNEAIRLFNTYGSSIGVTPYEPKKPAATRPSPRVSPYAISAYP